MRRWLARACWVLFGILPGVIGGWWLARASSADRVDRVVAMSWGDGRYGPAFYGAHVYLDPLEAGGFAVHARVFIGRNTSLFAYVHDMGELGRVASAEEAVARWGELRWQADGLRIGPESSATFLPRSDLENHR